MLAEASISVVLSQSHFRLCNPMDCGLPASSVPTILGWAAIPFSRGPTHFRDRTQVSCTSCTGTQTLSLSQRGSPVDQRLR